MRRFVVAFALSGFVSAASAGEFEIPDVPILRGSNPTVPSPYVPAPPTFVRWSGFYGGAQIGASRANVDFKTTVNGLVSDILRTSTIQSDVSNWTLLLKGDTDSFNVGGFLGFNAQWDDVILGVEASYGHTNLHKVASDSLSRSFINNGQAPSGHTFQYDVTVIGATSVQITDLWTARIRAGWVVDCLLPYAFAGGAVARANVFRTATVSGTLTDMFTVNGNPTSTTTPLDLPSLTEGQGGLFTFGYTAGLGADYMVLPNVIARAEWEFVQFQNVKGARLNINTVRAGLGLKF